MTETSAQPHETTRTARAKARPERTCAVTRTSCAPEFLIRFACGPDGNVVPDIRAKLPGRGVWIGTSVDLVRRGMARGVFARGFKRDVVVPDDLDAVVDRLLETAALQRVSLANKAGVLVAGQGKVDDLIAKGKAAQLIQAHDAAVGGRRRMAAKFQAMQRDLAGADAGDGVFVDGSDDASVDGAVDAAAVSATGPSTTAPIEQFSIAQLSLALGRPNVVHAAATEGSATTSFVQAADRLQRYRSAAPWAAPTDPRDGSDVDLNHELPTDERTVGR
ncbi:MAG: DUF448 domain-containing protein [Pseudomonadota bacterium]